jgi:hypothetical protein
MSLGAVTERIPWAVMTLDGDCDHGVSNVACYGNPYGIIGLAHRGKIRFEGLPGFQHDRRAAAVKSGAAG